MPDGFGKEIKEYLEKYHSSRKTRMLKKRSDMISYIRTNFYPHIEDDGEVAFLYVNGFDDRPKCVVCGNYVQWHGKKYYDTCSKVCSNKKNDTFGKMKAVLQEKHGVENAQKIPEVQKKRIQTMNEKYGANVSPNHVSNDPEHWKILNSKGRDTLFERYGVRHPVHLPDHQKKKKLTLIERYGDDFNTIIRPSMSYEEKKKHYQGMFPDSENLVNVQPPDIGQENDRFVIECSCGNHFVMPFETVKFRLRMVGRTCSVCSGISTSRSIKEQELFDYIKSIYDGEVVSNTRGVISPYEIDIYIPEKSIGIEFCGLYWHNEERVGRRYHLDKMLMCNSSGIRLIQIFEDEWTFQKDIVKTRLKNILGLNTDRIFARKCRVEEISPKVAREFCEKNHIQGYTNASVKLGLFRGERLVSVMTFSRPTIAKGNLKSSYTSWELSRFCSEVSVVGGANKLFKYFLDNYLVSRVITYSDLRWNTGDVYLKMGFKYSHRSIPNYWYFKGENRLGHRFKFRKNSQDNPNLTEYENRKIQGYRRIFDCGNDVFVYGEMI